jgi:hypothetical protein
MNTVAALAAILAGCASVYAGLLFARAWLSRPMVVRDWTGKWTAARSLGRRRPYEHRGDR